MRVSRRAAFGVCLAVAACGGAIAPTGGQGDGGSGGDSSSSGSSSSGVVGGSSSSGPPSSGSSGTGASSSGSGSGSASSSGSSSSGSGSSSGAVIDSGPACDNGVPPPMTGNMACDDCVEVSCGADWCACGADSAVDDAGVAGGCLGYVNCIIACVDGNPEAGVPPQDGGLPECVTLCGNGAYTAQQQAEGQSLISCLASNCASQATCGQ